MEGSFFRRASNGLVCGIVAGCLAVTAMTAADVRLNEEDAIRPVLVSEGAAVGFVDTWSRMLRSTWSVESTFVRTTDEGRRFSVSLREVNRPPDYLSAGAGSAELRVGGRRYACGVTADSRLENCRDAGESSHEERVRSQLAAVSSQVRGESRLYDVERQDGDCYRLFARGGSDAGAWGSRALVCFDARTGALSRSEIHHQGVTDVVQAESISSEVDDAELRLPNPS